VQTRWIAAAASILILIGALAGLPALADRTDYEWFDPIIVIRRHLLDSYVEQPDEQAMQERMIRAMIETLDDPYTVYIPPTGEAEFNKDVRGTYVGIGAEVVIQDGLLTIVTPMEGSPALEAGIRAGDVMLEIEGNPTEHRSIAECIDLLLGDAGTPVTVRVRHPDGSEEDLAIVRRQIVTPTVRGARREGEAWNWWLDEARRIGYTRLTQFNDASIEDLKTALAGLASGGMRGLVLDLRDNPGGDLAVATQVADLFLAEGLIVEVRGRARPALASHAAPDMAVPDVPMVVVVNGLSASASEIVAGALQANSRAKVLGTRTFGKGSVQEVYDLLYNCGMLKVTTAHYYLKGGRRVARTAESAVWGVDPDPGFVVPMTDDEVREMILARRRFESIRPVAAAEPQSFGDPEWIRRELRDPQLAAALEALRGRLEAGEWPAVGGTDPTRVELEDAIQRYLELRRHRLEQIDAIDQRIQELYGLAAEQEIPPLLPPGADPSGGTLTLHDAAGNVIGAFRIQDGDVESTLRELHATPLQPPG
jgi:carboxyl-terminal processing protease